MSNTVVWDAPEVGAEAVQWDEPGTAPMQILGTLVQRMRESPQPKEEELRSQRYVVERMPFAGAAISAAADLEVARSATRIRDGAAAPGDYTRVADFMVRAERSGERSFGGQVFDVLTQIPGFVVEFASTGGAFTSAKQATAKVVGTGAKTMAGRAVQAALPRAAGVLAQTASNPQLVARSTAQRMMPAMQAHTGADGEVVSVEIGDDQAFLKALPQGFVDTMIELGSERAGGKLAQGAGKLFGLVPGSQQVKNLKATISQKWLAAKPGRTFAMLDETLKAGGWNGVVGEVLEERTGDVARLATGLEGPDENVVGQLATGQFSKAGQQLSVEAAAFSVPGAVNVGARRLAQLKSIRAKGYVSAEDGQIAGIEGGTRKERLASVDAEIQQLTQEMQNAPAVPEAETEVRPEQGGEDVRVEGQEQVRPEPAGEGASEVLKSRELLDWLAAAEAAAPEVQPELMPHLRPTDQWQDLPVGSEPADFTASEGIAFKLGAGGRWQYANEKQLLATERDDRTLEGESRPLTPAEVQGIIEQGIPAPQPRQPESLGQIEIGPEGKVVEQPKRDVSAEIREALASGPVTVTTPQVPGGFKIAKVREDGKVVSTKGRVITPDETWQVQKPAPPAEAPPSQLPPYRRQPADYMPGQAHGWLHDAVSRRPAGLKSPEEIAGWINQGFPQGNWRSYAEQQGHTSLEQSVAKVMDEITQQRVSAQQPAATPIPPGAQAEAGQKQPWEMSRAEYSQFYRDNYKSEQARVGNFPNLSHENEVRQAVESGKPVPPEVLADYPDLQAQPKKRTGRKDKPLADVLEPAAVAKTAAEVAAEKGEYYVVPFANQSKRFETEKALREAGLEPVPEKLNYWRVAEKPQPKAFAAKPPVADKWRVQKEGDKFVVQSTVGGGRRYTTIPGARYGTEAEAGEALARMKEAADVPKKSRGKKKTKLQELAPARPEKPKAASPAFMDQWRAAKEEMGEHGLVAVRVGNQYEFYGEDVDIVSKRLGLTKHKRMIDGKPESMAGFPYHQIDAYLKKLISLGFRVGVIEEQPPAAKPSGKTKLQQAADTATKDAFDELDSFGKMLKGKGLPSNPMLDPEVIAGAGRVVAKFAKAGTLKFAALIEHLTKSIGQAAVDRIRPLLEAEWDRLQKSGDFAGMEPRTPEAQAEPPPPSGDDLTSIKKAIVNELRAMVGLPEMEGSTPQTVEQWAESARGALAADPKAGIRLVNELATNPRPISQHDAMLLQFRYRQLANELEPVVDEYFEAVKSKDPVTIATSRTALINARKAMTDFEETIHPSKETWGRTGVALQQMLRKDFSLEAILRRGQEANDGQELSPDQTTELTKLSKQLEDLQKQFDQQRRKSEELEAELASKRQHEETVKETKRAKIHRKSDQRKAAEKKVEDAWAKFRAAAGSQAGAGAHLLGPAVDLAKAYVELGYVRFGEFIAAVRKNVPDADEKLFRQAWDEVAPASDVDLTEPAALTKEARRIQRTLVELGMTDREQVIGAVHEALKEEIPDLTRRQTMDALSRYGQFQTQSQDEIEKILRGMNAEILKLSQIDQIEKAMKRVDQLRAAGKSDEEIGKALADEKLLVEATGLVRDRPSQTVRQLTQKYNELKKAIPATPEGKAGLLQTALAQVERALANRIQDLRWEIERGERIVREKHERPTSERVEALEAERDALLKIHREMFPPKKKTLTEAQRIQSAIRAADRAIEQLEKQLETRDFDREKRGPLASPELDSRRARLSQLRAAREAAKALELSQWEGEGGAVPRGKVPLTKEQIARRVYEASLRKRIADYQQILSEGDFSPKPKKGPRELSASELKLKREMEDVRHRVLHKYADYHLAHLEGIAWTADKISEAAHLSRALMTSFDLSALLRQGGLAAMGHPVLAKRALFETVASIAHTFDREAIGKDFKWADMERFLTGIDSRQAEFDLMHKLTEGPAGEFRLRAGLNLPSTDQAITKQEEAFQGRWGKLVPGVAVSSRLYTMILNKLRADLFDSMVQNLGRSGQVTLDEAKVIANFVNVATGRANLGKFNGWAAALNTVFFAPRYVASRFQYLAMPFYLPLTGGSWRVKRAILQEYGRTAVGIGTVLGLFALLGMLLYDDDDEDRPRIETDPRSSDFLKVRIGETRLDFLAGLSQVIVLSSRMISGQTKSSVSGKVRNFGEGYRPETRATTLARFGRTKLAPVPGAIATIADDWTNVTGQKETPLSMAGSIVTPLSLKDVSTTMQAQGIPKGTAMSLLSILGVGMNTYGPKTQYMTGSPEERQAQIASDLKNMAWDSPEPAYSEFLTEEQLAQFEARKQEKRGLVVYNATYDGENEDELKTREKNREYLAEMGLSFEEARELLKDYYRRPDEKGRAGSLREKDGDLKEGYAKRLRTLKRMYASPTGS